MKTQQTSYDVTDVIDPSCQVLYRPIDRVVADIVARGKPKVPESCEAAITAGLALSNGSSECRLVNEVANLCFRHSNISIARVCER